MLDEKSVKKLKTHHIYTMGTATCVEEAVELEKSGVDAIVAQGIEAGGHRGSFLNEKSLPYIGLIALVTQIKDAVNIPVIASGGLYDKRTIAAAFDMGADAVQIGSHFISAEESAATDVYRDLIKKIYGYIYHFNQKLYRKMGTWHLQRFYEANRTQSAYNTGISYSECSYTSYEKSG